MARGRFDAPNWDVIQGGMGVAVSDYRLARVTGRRAVGVVSGTAMADVLARRLQDGDPTGEMREALSTFSNQAIADRAIRMYFQEQGERPDGQSLWYRVLPMFNHNSQETGITADMTVLGAYVETYLAKLGAGGNGVIGLNMLTKLDRPNMHAIAGAMMAGTDVVIMGAGIPDQIPKLIYDIKNNTGERIVHNVHVQGRGPATVPMSFDIGRYSPNMDVMQHPAFLAVVAHHDLAVALSEQEYPPDGYVVEAPTAGGHNAPARGSTKNERGEPVYTEQDTADLSVLLEMSLTFWLAGQRGTHDDYVDAIMSGARGVQVGTAFALARESGWDPGLKQRIIDQIATEEGLDVYTDTRASPSGMPFKIARIADTLSDGAIYQARQRICDIGHLRTLQHSTGRDGKPKIDSVCTAEPNATYLQKAGVTESLPPNDIKRRVAGLRQEGVICLCNGLLAAAGYPQIRDGVREPALVTTGDDANRIFRLLNTDNEGVLHPEWPITADRVLHFIRTGDNDYSISV